MIWNPLTLLRLAVPDRRQAADMVSRWSRAFIADPDLANDIIILAGLLEGRQVRLDRGDELPEPIDPYRLAMDKGQRDFALTLLALGRIESATLNTLLEDQQWTE